MLDAFAPEDEDRIAGLDMQFERPNPRAKDRAVWALDAFCDPLPPGID